MVWFNASRTVIICIGIEIRHNIPFVPNSTKLGCCINLVSYLKKASAETRCNKHKPKDVILLLILNTKGVVTTHQQHIGVEGTALAAWFEDFLTKRTQRIRIG